MKNQSAVPPRKSTLPIRQTHIHFGSWLLLLLFLFLPPAVKAQLSFFPIATNGASMGCAFDGSNYLVGIENHQTVPTTIGAQMISRAGNKMGPLIPTGRSGIAAAVVFDGTNYLVVWEDDGLNTLNGSTGWQVYGQFIGKTGTPVGNPFAISTPGVWFNGIKMVAFGAGKYLVTYTRLIVPANGAASNNRYIAGKILNPDGSMGDEFRISTGFGNESDVGFDGSNFLVVWCEDSGDSEIRGRFVSPAGLPGTEISINDSPAPSDNPKAVAFDGANYLVAWDDEVSPGNWQVMGQLVSPSGNLVGSVISISTEPGPQMPTSVAFDGDNYFAAWIDMSNGTNWDVYGQFIGRNGSLLGGKVTLSTDSGNQMVFAGFYDKHYVIAVANGVIMGEGGLSQVDNIAAAFLSPLAHPSALTTDSAFGIRTNRFGFTVAATSGQVVVVEACTNISNPVWQPILTNTFTNSAWYFSEAAWTNYPGRFYRVRTP